MWRDIAESGCGSKSETEDVVEDDRMKELRELCGAGVAFKVAQACMEEGCYRWGRKSGC